MNQKKFETVFAIVAIGTLIVLGAIAVFGFALGVNCVIALFAQWVAGGFGFSIPFWPTVGLLFLVQIVLGGFRTRIKFKNS